MDRFNEYQTIIPDAVALQAKHRGAKAAIVCGDRRLTWAQFGERVDRVANGLIDRGLKKGDKVSLLSSNCLEMPEIIMGVVRAGGVIVPLSALVTGESLARMIENSDSRFVFAHANLTGVIDPYRESFPGVTPDHFFSILGDVDGWNSYDAFLDAASSGPPNVSLNYRDAFNIMYTSGTTGLPKGILHTHGNRMYFAVLGGEFSINSGSVCVATTSLYANGTWVVTLPALFCGATLVIMEAFNPVSFAQVVQQEKGTHTFMAPVQFQVILEQVDLSQGQLDSMRIWVSGGSAMRTDIKNRVLESFPGELMELWGLTEGVGTTIQQAELLAGKLESVGIAMHGNEVRIIDDQGRELPPGELGEIVGYGPFLMPEYYKLPDKTAESIWLDEAGRTYLKTGDMGKIDEDGYLYILDRKKDMIVSGGINIFASDIEEILSKHPAINDVTVIGVPHEKWGETPLALVIRQPGAEVSADEIIEWSKPRLAKYQRLNGVAFVEEFPRNALGKVLKRQLREPYWESQ